MVVALGSCVGVLACNQIFGASGMMLVTLWLEALTHLHDWNSNDSNALKGGKSCLLQYLRLFMIVR